MKKSPWRVVSNIVFSYLLVTELLFHSSCCLSKQPGSSICSVEIECLTLLVYKQVCAPPSCKNVTSLSTPDIVQARLTDNTDKMSAVGTWSC